MSNKPIKDELEQRVKELELEESEEKIRTMMKQSPSMIEAYNTNGVLIDIEKEESNLELRIKMSHFIFQGLTLCFDNDSFSRKPTHTP